MRTRVLRFRVTQTEFDRLVTEARETGVPVSTLVRLAIAEWVEAVEADPSPSPPCPTPRSPPSYG